MSKKVIILCIVNVLVILLIIALQPHCEPCIDDKDCPICISNNQIVLSVLLLIGDIFVLLSGMRTKKRQ